MRDDFSQRTKEVLQKRARSRCSNPFCRKDTIVTHSAPDKIANLGVAAHITAASPEGPRYDPNLTPEERKSILNAIWLCQSCGKLVDSDPEQYTLAVLMTWKYTSEAGDEREAERLAMFTKVEQLMPVLLTEMRQDLAQSPLKREIVISFRRHTYNGKGNELIYYHEDHTDLLDKMTILCNYKLLADITYNNVKRYQCSELLADYLIQPKSQILPEPSM